jgi:hypothetical protein
MLFGSLPFLYIKLDLDCTGTQSSQRVGDRTVEILRTCERELSLIIIKGVINRVSWASKMEEQNSYGCGSACRN